MTEEVVTDSEGTRYILEKRSSDASRVRDPTTGERLHLPNDELEVVSGESALSLAAQTVSPDVVSLITSVPDERTLGLLLELERRGPTPVRTILDISTFCESDLHRRVALLTARDIIRETKRNGERCYELTEGGHRGLSAIK